MTSLAFCAKKMKRPATATATMTRMVQLKAGLVAFAIALYFDKLPLATLLSRSFHLLKRIPHRGHSFSSSLTGAWHWGQFVICRNYKTWGFYTIPYTRPRAFSNSSTTDSGTSTQARAERWVLGP